MRTITKELKRRVWVLTALLLIGWSTALGKKDTLYTLQQVMQLHLVQPDSALYMLDVMEQQRWERPWLIQAQRALVYTAKGQYHLAVNHAQKAFAADSLQRYPSYYMQTLTCCITANQQLNRWEESLRLIDRGIAFARKHGNRTFEANLLFTMGQTYYKWGQRNEAYDYFHRAIRMGEEAEGHRLKPFLSFFYGELVSHLAEEERWEEALAITRKREELIRRMKTFPKIPKGYIDQQYTYLYIKQAYILAKLDRKGEAEACYRRFADCSRPHSFDNLENQAMYWLSMKQYRQIIENLPLQEVADTITPDYANQLEMLVQAYRGLKDYARASQLQLRLAVINDSLNVRVQQQKLFELATLNRLHEKEWYIDQQKKEDERDEMVRRFLLAGILLMGLAIGFLIYHMRMIRHKNQLMANQLDLLLAHEEEIARLEQKVKEQATAQTEGNDDPEYQTFRRLERLMKEEQLYLNPELNRQDLLNRLSIDKNRFAQMMQKYVSQTLPQYLTELRVRHAIHQMQEHPNFSIKAIAESSGFANLRNFQRAFKLVTGMTASDYKGIYPPPNVRIFQYLSQTIQGYLKTRNGL